ETEVHRRRDRALHVHARSVVAAHGIDRDGHGATAPALSGLLLRRPRGHLTPLVVPARRAHAVRLLDGAAVGTLGAGLLAQEVVRAAHVAAGLAVSVLWVRHRGSPCESGLSIRASSRGTSEASSGRPPGPRTRTPRSSGPPRTARRGRGRPRCKAASSAARAG